MRDVMLIFHFIGLAMGLGTSFAMMFLGIAASNLEKPEAEEFTVNTFALSKMGMIGLTLLILSGGYLMTPYWKILGNSPLLIIKLCLVAILVILISILSVTVRKVRQNGLAEYGKKIKLLGQLSLVTSLTIVILAVFNFH